MITYQKAEIIYDGTYYFCNKYFRLFDRTITQMVQAARLTSFLIAKQIKILENDFQQEDGLRERMSQARLR